MSYDSSKLSAGAPGRRFRKMKPVGAPMLASGRPRAALRTVVFVRGLDRAWEAAPKGDLVTVIQNPRLGLALFSDPHAVDLQKREHRLDRSTGWHTHEGAVAGEVGHGDGGRRRVLDAVPLKYAVFATCTRRDQLIITPRVDLRALTDDQALGQLNVVSRCSAESVHPFWFVEVDARYVRVVGVARDEEPPQVSVLNDVRVLRGELGLSGSLSRLADRARAVRHQEQEQ